MNEENNNISITNENADVGNKIDNTLDNNIIKCGNFNIQDFVSPIQPISSDQRAELNKLFESAKNTNMINERTMLDTITERLLNAEYMQLNPSFLNIPYTNKFGDDTEWVISRFCVFPYSQGDNMKILVGVYKKKICIDYYFQNIKNETIEFPEIISKNLVMSSEFYSKDTILTPNKEYYVFNKKIDRQVRKKYGNIDDNTIITWKTPNMLIPEETKQKMQTNKFSDDNKFIILDGKEDNLVREYPLFVGVHNDKIYLIDNPAMDEYKRLGL